MHTRSPLITRFVIGVDMQNYSGRSTRVQDDLRKELGTLLADAAAVAGMDAGRWELFDTGDGKLAVLPPDVDLAAVVGRFVDELDARLVERNGDRAPATQLRLRVAMHSDGLVASPPGYAGPALVVLSRYLDSEPVRRALRTAEGAGLALILSDTVYRTVVQAGLGGLRPERYRHVDVDIPAKSFHASGFVYVPGHDMTTFGPTDAADAADEPAAAGPAPAPPPPASAAGSVVGFVTHGGVTNVGGNVNVTHGDHVAGDKYTGRDR